MGCWVAPQSESEHFGEYESNCFWKENLQFLGAYAHSLVTVLTELFLALLIRLAFIATQELLAVCHIGALWSYWEHWSMYQINKHILHICCKLFGDVVSDGAFNHYSRSRRFEVCGIWLCIVKWVPALRSVIKLPSSRVKKCEKRF
jgi:hypothetical protein